MKGRGRGERQMHVHNVLYERNEGKNEGGERGRAGMGSYLRGKLQIN